MSGKHDKLQYQCFMYLWNERPELRYLFWSTFNDIKLVEKLLGAMMGVKLTSKVRMAILSTMKTLGMVKGILDFMFYYKNVLYVMDFKVGADRLSKEQNAFIKAIEEQGGVGMEIRSLEKFKEITDKIIKNEDL